MADVKSLVIHPATTTHSQLTPEELEDQGIRPNTIRLSVGTEHIDLERGFAAVRQLHSAPNAPAPDLEQAQL